MLNVFTVFPQGTTKSPSPADSACCRSPGRSLHAQRGELSSEKLGLTVCRQLHRRTTRYAIKEVVIPGLSSLKSFMVYNVSCNCLWYLISSLLCRWCITWASTSWGSNCMINKGSTLSTARMTLWESYWRWRASLSKTRGIPPDREWSAVRPRLHGSGLTKNGKD